MMSCGRCDCCTSAYDVVTKTGNTKFLAALGNITADDIPSYLKMPGLVGTLLAPSDAAWTAAEKKYGSELYDPDVLLEVFKYHFLPPEPRTKGLWTTPFLALGAKIYTSSDAVSTITSSKHVIPKNTTILGGITGIKLTGVSNSATIVTADLNACKVVVNIIDEVLWPFDLNTTTGSDGSSKISTALGLGNCDPLPNAEINATILVEGSANRLATPGACCDACEAHVGCNVWSYCPLAGGCRFPDGTTLLFGECTLQRSAELAAGSPLVWSDSGFAAVPTLSGYISNIAESTARANAPKAGTKSETAAAEASSSVNTSIIN